MPNLEAVPVEVVGLFRPVEEPIVLYDFKLSALSVGEASPAAPDLFPPPIRLLSILEVAFLTAAVWGRDIPPILLGVPTDFSVCFFSISTS